MVVGMSVRRKEDPAASWHSRAWYPSVMRRALVLLFVVTAIVACSTSYQSASGDGGTATGEGKSDASAEDAARADGAVASDGATNGDATTQSHDGGKSIGEGGLPAFDGGGVSCPVMCSCSGSDTCNISAGDGAQITCSGFSDCYVTCTGTCKVTCTDDADCFCPPNAMCVEQTSGATCHTI
jgi:hypothetical protein